MSEYHRLITEGTLVKPVLDQDSAWRMSELFDDALRSEAAPLERTYWKSRQRNEEF